MRPLDSAFLSSDCIMSITLNLSAFGHFEISSDRANHHLHGDEPVPVRRGLRLSLRPTAVALCHSPVKESPRVQHSDIGIHFGRALATQCLSVVFQAGKPSEEILECVLR